MRAFMLAPLEVLGLDEDDLLSGLDQKRFVGLFVSLIVV